MLPVWRARRRLFYGPYILYVFVAFVLLGALLTGAAQATAAGLLGLGGLILVFQASLAAMRIGGFIAESDVATEQGLNAYRSVERIERMSEADARTTESGRGDPAGLPRTVLRFDKVSFAYPGGLPVLTDLDLTIEAGRSLAIVGLNGTGKTTLVKLLARLYEPTAGAITADGVDIRTFPTTAWQRRVAAIFQDFTHFEFAGARQHRFRRDRDARGAEACRQGGPGRPGEGRGGGFRRPSPRGLETPLSRRYAGGAELSGGQWQRIAIARALVAVEGGASILVLDEPTANLDVRSEVAFFERFLDLTRGVTSVVISHRFSTVRRADRIVVLEHGRVVEQGTHEELLALDGRYAELFRLQAARFTEEEVGSGE